MIGAAQPPGSPREACGHLEEAVLLASGPLPPNMGRQNGGLVGWGESEATSGFHATLELQLPACPAELLFTIHTGPTGAAGLRLTLAISRGMQVYKHIPGILQAVLSVCGF